MGLKARPHHVEDPRPEPSRGLELVEHDDDPLPGSFRERLRQIERALEEPLRVGLSRELQGHLDVLVPHLHRRSHSGGDGSGLLEAPLDAREVSEDGIGQALAKPAYVRRPEAVDVCGVGSPAP